MSPADRTIGSWLLENPEKMLRLSSSALAAEVGRGQSSVVKFSQKLGFTSFQELKLAVSEARAQDWQTEQGLIHGSIEQSDGVQEVHRKLVSSKLMAVQQTHAVNTAQEINRALELLLSARRIYLTGVGASALVARDFSYKLLKLGRAVIHADDSHIQLANVSAMTERDVLVALSHSGRSMETLRIAELAHARGGQILAITGLERNPLSVLAGVLLHTVADEDRVRSSSITVRDAQLTLTDLLFLLLVQRQPDAPEFIHASETAVAVLKGQSERPS